MGGAGFLLVFGWCRESEGVDTTGEVTKSSCGRGCSGCDVTKVKRWVRKLVMFLNVKKYWLLFLFIPKRFLHIVY